MTDRQPSHPDKPETRRMDFGSLLAIGLTLGMLLGTALDELSFGLGLGLLVGTTVNAYYEYREGEHQAGIAFGIAVTALVVFVAVYALSWAGCPGI